MNTLSCEAANGETGGNSTLQFAAVDSKFLDSQLCIGTKEENSNDEISLDLTLKCM